ncbi:hypothetical protein N9H39_05025 [Gammaproteobacteria bacterium]|nr:hypothetical protein [Gammaproteobacteria bacterium]
MVSDFFSQHSRLILFTVLCSFALSVWCVWADPIINNDGVYYFRTAEKISLGNWAEAISIYSWPFYPAFIAYLSKLTGVDVVGAAYILNAVLAAVLVVGFLSVVFELGGDRNTLIFAALLILAFPTLNKYRSFIIRDIGYLAFYIWSLSYMFRYWKDRNNLSLLGWFLCAAATSLFRVEGIAILAAVPVMVFSLTQSGSRGKWKIIFLYMTLGFLLFILLSLWLIRDISFDGLSEGVDSRWDIFAGIAEHFSNTVGRKLELLKEKFAGRYYLFVYMMIIVFVAAAEVVRRLALIYAVLAVWGFKKKIIFPVMSLKPLWLAMVLVNFLILVGSAFFISIVVDRYALATTVTILLASPFVYAHLWKHWASDELSVKKKWVLPALLVLSTLLGANGLNVFTDKRYLSEAGLWIKENTPENSTLYSNNLILIHYSGKDAFHKGDDYSWKYAHAVIKSKKWMNYDYIAIVLGAGEYHWIEWLDIHLHGPPLKRISDGGDSVLIYKNDRE